MQFISVSWSRLDIDIYGRRSIAIGRWCVVIGGWVCRRRSIIVRRIGRRRSVVVRGVCGRRIGRRRSI